MKRWMRLLLILFCLGVLAGSSSVPVAANTKKAVKNGWDGSRYYRDGKPLVGLQKIGERYFFFNSNGVMHTGWKTIDGKRYYFRDTGKTGVIGRACRGVKEIDGKYYYFRMAGAMRTGWVTFKKTNTKSYFNSKGERVYGLQKINGKWYYFDSSGTLLTKAFSKDGGRYYPDADGEIEYFKKSGKMYMPDGKKMTAEEKEDYLTFERARKLVKEITSPQMSTSQKLEACFRWVMKKPYVMRRYFRPEPGWPALYANDMFLRGGGDCRADGASFAYLAKALGYDNIYVCLDSLGTGGSVHCWTEIDGKVYDPLFAKAKSYARNYGVSYSVYGLSARRKAEIVNWC